MTGFPVVNQVYASCEFGGSLVKLLAVNSHLAFVYEPITHHCFPQFTLCDQRSLMEAGLHLMVSHQQQLVLSSVALLSRLTKNNRKHLQT